MDQKPHLICLWSKDVPAARLPFGVRVGFWQLVRMKARPQEQAWVYWCCKHGDAPFESIEGIGFPFEVELHFTEIGSNSFDGGLRFKRESMLAVLLAGVAGHDCIAYSCV